MYHTQIMIINDSYSYTKFGDLNFNITKPLKYEFRVNKLFDNIFRNV